MPETVKSTKAQLLRDIRGEYKQLEASFQGMTEADMVKATAPGEWSVKDNLAHINTWEKWFLRWYETGIRGIKQVMPDWRKPGLIDNINWGIYQNNLELPLAEVLKDLRATHKRALKIVQNIPKEDLFVPSRYDWLGRDTLAQYIVANTSGHYTQHIAMIEVIKKKLEI